MKNNFILIALALFSIGLLFFVKSHDPKPQHNTQAKKNPQEYMTHFFVTVFTTEGHLKNKLSECKLIYPNLNDPAITYDTAKMELDNICPKYGMQVSDPTENQNRYAY